MKQLLSMFSFYVYELVFSSLGNQLWLVIKKKIHCKGLVYRLYIHVSCKIWISTNCSHIEHIKSGHSSVRITFKKSATFNAVLSTKLYCNKLCDVLVMFGSLYANKNLKILFKTANFHNRKSYLVWLSCKVGNLVKRLSLRIINIIVLNATKRVVLLEMMMNLYCHAKEVLLFPSTEWLLRFWSV